MGPIHLFRRFHLPPTGLTLTHTPYTQNPQNTKQDTHKPGCTIKSLFGGHLVIRVFIRKRRSDFLVSVAGGGRFSSSPQLDTHSVLGSSPLQITVAVFFASVLTEIPPNAHEKVDTTTNNNKPMLMKLGNMDGIRDHTITSNAAADWLLFLFYFSASRGVQELKSCRCFISLYCFQSAFLILSDGLKDSGCQSEEDFSDGRSHALHGF